MPHLPTHTLSAGHCPESDAPFSVTDSTLYAAPRHDLSWRQGLQPEPRPHSLSGNSSLLAAIVVIVMAICISIRPVRRLLHAIPMQLGRQRKRQNAFDIHTASESRVFILFLLILFLAESLILYCWLTPPFATPAPATQISRLAVLFILSASFYLFQLATCALIGYTFTTPDNAAQWRMALHASQILLAIALALPALATLFYPGIRHAILILAPLIYIALRIPYIIKGFRIFYTNFASILYFILYLCALEIIPPLVWLTAASAIVG